jgi:O-methyltransferase involved in polyketide biosynthesis
MYLPEEAARETLRFVGAHPPGSGIVFDFVYRAMIDMIAQQMSPERMREQQRLSAYHLAEAVVAS